MDGRWRDAVRAHEDLDGFICAEVPPLALLRGEQEGGGDAEGGHNVNRERGRHLADGRARKR